VPLGLKVARTQRPPPAHARSTSNASTNAEWGIADLEPVPSTSSPLDRAQGVPAGLKVAPTRADRPDAYVVRAYVAGSTPALVS
jgi:hypothetical protein